MEVSSVRAGELEATLVSEPVLAIVRRGGRGHVHSVFGAVVNLELDGRLVAVTGPSIDPVPNGIGVSCAIDFRRAGLRPGLTVLAQGTRLTVLGPDLAIDLATASVWSPRLLPVDSAARIAPRSRWRSGSRWLARAAPARGHAATVVARRPDALAGLGALLAPAQTAPGPGVGALAAPRLAELVSAVSAADTARASDAAMGLLGLGPGLTPSGDDALVGVAAAISALAGADAGALEFLEPVVEAAPERTTAIAASYLRHAAAGEFAGGIHRLLGALLGADDHAVDPAIERALSWGATSGTDTLVGVLAGLDALAGLPGLAGLAIRRAA